MSVSVLTHILSAHLDDTSPPFSIAHHSPAFRLLLAVYSLTSRADCPTSLAEAQQRLKQTLPRVEIVTMPGLGHYPSEEDTPGFLTIANTFLGRAR